MLTMNSHGTEISIAGGVVEMVRDPNPTHFFSSFYIMRLLVLGTRGFE